MTDTVELPILDFPRLSLKEGVDTSRPIPILIKVAKDGETPNIFYAPTAERFAVDLKAAEYLETHAATQTPEAKAHARAVREAKALISAPTLTPEEWSKSEEWADWVCDGEETYASSVEELVEQLADMEVATPSYCYVTTARGFDFDLENAVETYLMDEHHEDAECTHLDKLIDFFNEWKKTETVKTYWPGSTIVVIDPARFADEIAAAKTLVAEGFDPQLALNSQD
ncbi:hypothetical protein [Brevundimonas sp.]|uniref:hypothetical protein n=1 Tax=Brevundimonas sp. TaxID=1871086 RepID=UPI0025C31AB2|nr:hypothetical protein [Brevundimonas sp.]MCG2662894.1 hypothetical protein [Brevundimonas sp.]